MRSDVLRPYPRRMRLGLILASAVFTVSTGCGSRDEGENLACSWSGSADAHQQEAAHICVSDRGEITAHHFQPGSTISLGLRTGPKVLTVKEDGTAKAKVANEPGIVPVTGTKATGERFSNGLTLLPIGK